jgi:hypothetical protein
LKVGTQNRQRRAAKQRKRQQGAAKDHGPRSGTRSSRCDDIVEVSTIIYAAAEAVRSGDSEAARALIEILETGPPVPDAASLVARALGEVLAQYRALVLAHGWTPDDLDELELRRLKLPAGSSDVERQVKRLGLLAGLPALPSVAPPRPKATAESGMLAKIRALLAKAESTTFPEEAESLSAKAQELMARHRIDRALVDVGDATSGPVGRRIWLDDPYADAKAQLLAEVAAANRCRSVLMSRIGCSHLIGFPADLDMTELLHTSLLVQATRAMAAAGPQTDRRGRSRTRSFRQSFLIAYARRIGTRLRQASASAENEVDVERGGDLLPVLARRDAQVEEATARVFPKTAPMRTSASNAAGWAAGAAAADLADLSVGQALPEMTGRPPAPVG